MSQQSKLQKYINFLPPVYKAGTNPFVTALVKALANSDADVEVSIQNAGEQIFQATATGNFLDALGSNVGVSRPTAVNLSDASYSQLIPILSYKPKQLRITMYQLLDVFWGPLYSRSNITSSAPGPYNLGNTRVMTGVLTFLNGGLQVSGIGCSFTTQIASGDYIKFGSDPVTDFLRVSRVINDNLLTLSAPYQGGFTGQIQSGGGSAYTPLILSVAIDNNKAQQVPILPNYIQNTSAAEASEVVNAINANFPNQLLPNILTASVVADFITGLNYVNIRTNTPGPLGSVNVQDSNANLYANGVLNFSGFDVFISNTQAAQFANGDTVVAGSSTQPHVTTTIVSITPDTPSPGTSTVVVTDDVSAFLEQDENFIYKQGGLGIFEGLRLISSLQLQTVIYEINPKELIIKIPGTVPALRRELEGSVHMRGGWSGHMTNINLGTNVVTMDMDVTGVQANAYVGFTFSNQLNNYTIVSHTGGQTGVQFTFSPADDLSPLSTATGQNGVIILSPNYRGSFMYDPTGQAFTVTSVRCKLEQEIDAGNIYNAISVDGASEIPDALGYLIFNWGSNDEEQPVRYRGRPNNSTLLLDPTYEFKNNHGPGEIVNVLASGLQATKPTITGTDFPVYITGIEQATLVVESLLQSIAAAGVKLTFIVDIPTYLWHDADLDTILNS